MLGVAQLKLVASLVTTAIQVYAFTSALEKMSERREMARLAEREERREERRVEKEERRREKMEDCILLLSAAVIASVV